MKCDHCGYKGRGRRGYYISKVKGEHWRCPECGELTKIPVKKRLPSIKGYCRDCRYPYVAGSNSRCAFWGGEKIRQDGYCSEWKKKEKK